PTRRSRSYRERCHHHELRKRQVRLFRQGRRGRKGIFAIGRKSEDERPEHMHSVLLDCPETSGEVVTGQIEALEDGLSPSSVTDSTPTSAPLMRAKRMASRNFVSSPASMVICVKNTMSAGSFSSFSINSKRSARIAFSSANRVAFSCRRARFRSLSVTG